MKLSGILDIMGGIIGLLVTNILDIIIRPLVEVVLGELIISKNIAIAFKNSSGVLIGFLAGTLTKMIIALTIIGLFVANILF